MSIKIIDNVWQYSKQKGSALLLLLGIADNASDSGYAFPGIDYLARKTRLSTRQVIRLVKKIEQTDELTVIREKSHNEYVINVWPPDLNGIRHCERCLALDVPEIGAGLHKHHKTPKSQGGKDNPENIEILCKDCHELHHKILRDKMSRDKMIRLGDTHVTSDVTPMSPKPSLTVKEPSLSPPGEKSLSSLVTDIPGPPKIEELTKLPDASDPPDDFSDIATPHPLKERFRTNGPPLSESEIASLRTLGKLPGNIPPEYDIIQEIQAAHWDNLTTNELRAIALYVMAVRLRRPDFAIPNNPGVRNDWKKSVRGHLMDYPVNDFYDLYQLAITKLEKAGMAFSRPGSLTKTLPDIVSEKTVVQETFDLSHHKIVPPTPMTNPIKSTLNPQQIDEQFAKAREAVKNATD